MQVEESAAALEAYFEILSACFGGNSASIPRGAELRGQIQRYIAAHLSECTLDAAEIAYVTAFLASDRAWAVSGELVVATGGAGRAVYY